ncbi:transposase [Rhodovulum sulfidophilum]|uniref:Transposase n=1 Tax=Rhodovulum sulfidophilum TaxID=35806 RepID=A0A0D6AYF2_RHOSU|nr:transposase [Rhodovulum sulfidophilum]
MGRSVRKAAGKGFHHAPRDQLRGQLAAVMAAENFARRLKSLGGVMPREENWKIRISEPVRSFLVPIRQMPGSDT